ncbi:NAD(P)-binding domain-containing protein [Microbacterium aerolatum]|uniref:NADPH-dependent F420 reductase n=1 Tax=Microbacterium aerolatum TaxID=153731 RepID=UPI0020014688|nr:NAD(P)-binding domain-containing protein [Microbacterium aerolatum]MCK3770861.1 NAD(P)-binding domain-containing protein [Microbacterium aerolatum]
MSTPIAGPRSIGILGAGRVGTAVARQSLKAGYPVKIATAKPAHEISMLVDIVTPGARAVEAVEAATADLVVIAVPLHKYRSLDPSLLAGRSVIDVMNYWAPIDGQIDEFEADPRTSSEIIQAFLPEARLVKSLNHIGYHELEEDGKQVGAADRRALALAGDHDEAKAMVTAYLDRLGYDPVDAGPLSAGRAFQPGTEIFSGSHTANQLQAVLAAALAPSGH